MSFWKDLFNPKKTTAIFDGTFQTKVFIEKKAVWDESKVFEEAKKAEKDLLELLKSQKQNSVESNNPNEFKDSYLRYDHYSIHLGRVKAIDDHILVYYYIKTMKRFYDKLEHIEKSPLSRYNDIKLDLLYRQ